MDSTDFEEIRTIQRKYPKIAISSVLPYIYEWGIKAAPLHIVELGVSKEALANKVLTLVAEKFDSTFISCDLYDFETVNSYSKWHFVQAHDIEFAKGYWEFCASIGIGPWIDLLFIDTDEKYPHTKEEIEHWYPFLEKKCTVMWRCTNLKKELIYPGGIKTNLGWDNERGVVRALEEHYKWKIPEECEIDGIWRDPQGIDWEIHHYPWGAGLTVLRRIL
jgi:hypothetical protein